RLPSDRPARGPSHGSVPQRLVRVDRRLQVLESGPEVPETTGLRRPHRVEGRVDLVDRGAAFGLARVPGVRSGRARRGRPGLRARAALGLQLGLAALADA